MTADIVMHNGIAMTVGRHELTEASPEEVMTSLVQGAKLAKKDLEKQMRELQEKLDETKIALAQGYTKLEDLEIQITRSSELVEVAQKARLLRNRPNQDTAK